MKKKFIVTAFFLVTAGVAFAGEMTLGLKGTFSISTNKWADGEMEKIMENMRNTPGVENNRKSVMTGGGVDVFFRYDFLTVGKKFGFSLGVQPELGFHVGWGSNEKISFAGTQITAVDFTYNTLDIPILLTAGLKINKFRINVAVGPNFGFVLGKAKFKMEDLNMPDTTVNTKAYPFIMGLQTVAGVSCNFTKKHGITFDVRGIFDFTDLELAEKLNIRGNPIKAITRRTGIMLSLGYAYTF